MGFVKCDFPMAFLSLFIFSALEKNSSVTLWHVGSSQRRDGTWVSCMVRCILYHWATRKALGFFLSFYLSLLVLISVQCYFTVVLISNFLMIYDFWVFLIYLFTLYMFSLARCSDLSILNEVVCSRFLVLFEYNPLSDMYFVNVFLFLRLVFRFSD